MMFETPQDTYNAYTKFVKKKEYKKAYRCLEKVLHDVPDDTVLLLEIVDLCLLWHKHELVRLWLIKMFLLFSIYCNKIKI